MMLFLELAARLRAHKQPSRYQRKEGLAARALPCFAAILLALGSKIKKELGTPVDNPRM